MSCDRKQVRMPIHLSPDQFVVSIAMATTASASPVPGMCPLKLLHYTCICNLTLGPIPGMCL